MNVLNVREFQDLITVFYFGKDKQRHYIIRDNQFGFDMWQMGVTNIEFKKLEQTYGEWCRDNALEKKNK